MNPNCSKYPGICFRQKKRLPGTVKINADGYYSSYSPACCPANNLGKIVLIWFHVKVAMGIDKLATFLKHWENDFSILLFRHFLKSW
jgi:hypothetical protein